MFSRLNVSQRLPHMEPITTISFTLSYTNIRINEHHYSACRSNQTTLKNAHVESFDQVLDEVWIWSADVKLKAEVTFASRSQTGKVTGALSYNDVASEGTRKNLREAHLFCRSQKSPLLPQPQTTSWKNFSSLCVKTFPDFVEISRFYRFRVDSSFSA